MGKNIGALTGLGVLTAILAFSIVAAGNFAQSASAAAIMQQGNNQMTGSTSPSSAQPAKMHLDEGVKALQSGDDKVAMTHLNEALNHASP
jgi:Tfp pilus assembly protein PilF